ncbi:hypothetical protein [Cerasicoccus frondis]|uniref:hypothetical protein n=1 Tax=Cerasicoccus frondis TaxID=490090 RepID=UPI002852B510|nr:hypothetical protein [Cerasicoccus frondis]
MKIPIIIILCAAFYCAADNEYSTITSTFDGALNTIEIQSNGNSPGQWRIYETSSRLSNSVQILLPDSIAFEAVSTPVDWIYVSDRPEFGGVTYSRITWQYVGTTTADQNEFATFDSPWIVQIKVRDALEQEDQVAFNVPISINVHVNPNGSFEVLAGSFTETLFLEGRQYALSRWREQYGLAEDGSDDEVAFCDDGLPAIVKFAFNLGDPHSANYRLLDLSRPERGGLPLIRENDGYEISFVGYESNASGVTYTCLVSDSLTDGAWVGVDSIPGLVISEIIEPIEGSDLELITLRLDRALYPNCFIRLEVIPIF